MSVSGEGHFNLLGYDMMILKKHVAEDLIFDNIINEITMEMKISKMRKNHYMLVERNARTDFLK